jgi:hypothetical protein
MPTGFDPRASRHEIRAAGFRARRCGLPGDIMIPRSQPLFEIVAVNGVSMHFTILDPHQCAILRDGVVLETLGSDGEKMQTALKRYFELAKVEGGPRQRLQSIRLRDEPMAKRASASGPKLVASMDRRRSTR